MRYFYFSAAFKLPYNAVNFASWGAARESMPTKSQLKTIAYKDHPTAFEIAILGISEMSEADYYTFLEVEGQTTCEL